MTFAGGEVGWHVKRTIALGLSTIIAAGCLAAQTTPPQSSLSGLRAIAIVPIESPPLLLHPANDTERAAIAALGLAAPGGGGGISPGYLLLLPLFGIVGAGAIYAVTSSAPRAGETITLTNQPAPPWMPTAGLGMLAVGALQGAGRQQAFLADGYGALPVKDRSVNVYMENWMSAVRRWHNNDVSTLESATLGAPADAVLEIGVSNYEYIGSRLALAVHAKLSDARTKQVLGRARNWATPKSEPLAQMLRNDGEPLRHLIETTGERLLTQCLTDLGLLRR